MRTTAAFVVTLLITASLVLPSTAEARRRKRWRRARVVILPFSGPGAKAIRTRFIRAIRRRVRFIPYSRYRRTARRLRVRQRSRDGIVAACRRLRCEAVVVGKVKRRGRRYAAAVEVVDGASGKVIRRIVMRVRGKRRLRRVGSSLGARSVRLIAQGSAPAREPPPLEPWQRDPEPAEEQEAEETPPVRIVLGLGDSAEEEHEDDEEQDDEAKGQLRGIFDVYGSLGMSTRSFKLLGSDPAQDRAYDGGLYPEFTIGAEVYPLALLTRSFPRNLGLAFSYTHHIALSTSVPDNPDRPADCSFGDELDTTSQQLIVDLKLRWPIPGDWGPVLQASAGWGFREFSLGANDVLPSLNYQFIRLGGGARLPLGTPLIGLDAGFDIRVLLKAGQEAVDSLGPRSGGFGWSAYGGIRGDFSFGLFYFAAFEYQSYSSHFDGLNEDLVRECTPDRTDATSTSDRYLRFWAGAGYAM